jgi:hypothetical protein
MCGEGEWKKNAHKVERINNKLIGGDNEDIKNCNKKQLMLEMKQVVLQSPKKKNLDNAWRKRMEGGM